MSFLCEGDWGGTFDIFRSDGFNDVGFDEFVHGITKICMLDLCKLSLVWNFLRECCASWDMNAVFRTWNG